uniref:AlNc14C83G5366 protein n=1 Tax=Albugo laibachii Nc14 TaxID=890382 RepID=F0WFI1_9STRA|nr:AlNc14C83G5366 [Albugo laibachii Nc14]|eukprot:CCA19963.1 AlNc14C83G5366 [Albugo laibachii Nc14]
MRVLTTIFLLLLLLFIIVMQRKYKSAGRKLSFGDCTWIPHCLSKPAETVKSHNGKCAKYLANMCKECKAIKDAKEVRKKSLMRNRSSAIQIFGPVKPRAESDTDSSSDSDVDEQGPLFERASTSKSQETTANIDEQLIREVVDNCTAILEDTCSKLGKFKLD